MLGSCGMLFVSHQRGVPVRLMLALAITDDSNYRSAAQFGRTSFLWCRHS